MKKPLSAFLLLALVVPVQGAYVVRVKDLLQCAPTPPNPIKVAGRVTSVAPLKLNDHSGEITVVGAEAALSDFLVVTGDWDGTVLTVTGDVTAYVGPAVTEMVYVPAGSFLMGNNGNECASEVNEFPQHWVYLSGYWMGKYQVTRGEYRLFMEAGGYNNPAYWSSDGWNWRLSASSSYPNVGPPRTQPHNWGAVQNWGTGNFTQTDAHPVVGVHYYEAEAYCAWAGGQLPTEAQWEKAARWTGTYPNEWPWGNVWDPEKCNNTIDTNPAGGGYERKQTAPVGSYPAGVSPYGCHDMAGNVFELGRDWMDGSYYKVSPPSDPPGPESGKYRIMRGGSYSKAGVHGNLQRCSNRDFLYDPGYVLGRSVGFRLAR